jgi:hypothetical protein
VAQVAQAHQIHILGVQSHTQAAVVAVQATVLFNPAQVDRAVVLVDQVLEAQMVQLTEVVAVVVVAVLIMVALVALEL